MATSEALIKYYDCLKDSFNRIQDKDNQTALINAALRPKIREEFEKSQEVLASYLNYIQNKISSLKIDDNATEGSEDKAIKIHNAIQAIISSRPDLTDDFVHSVVKVFPSISDNRNVEDGINQTFITYLKNCIKVCTYLQGEHLVTVLTKILEKINPPPSSETQDEKELELIRKTVIRSYDIIYECLEDLNESQLEQITESLIFAFTREFLKSQNENLLNLLLLYLGSLKNKFSELFINSLWKTFIDPNKALEERRTSVAYASSFIARANYIGLDKVLEYLDAANNWCQNYLKLYSSDELSIENVELFHSLAQSIFYMITQRYREMYEEATIVKLIKLDLDKTIKSPLDPLEVCDIKIKQRFQEVATLYHIADSSSIMNGPSRKRRKSGHDVKHLQYRMYIPYPETSKNLPKRIRPLYRHYYDHRNFTIYRE